MITGAVAAGLRGTTSAFKSLCGDGCDIDFDAPDRRRYYKAKAALFTNQRIISVTQWQTAARHVLAQFVHAVREFQTKHF